jgi:hypothetical protein
MKNPGQHFSFMTGRFYSARTFDCCLEVATG